MRIRCLLALTTSILLAAAASVTHAKGLNYSYAEAGYSYLDADRFDANGATVKLSFAVLDFAHLKFDYTRFWVDDYKGAKDDPDLDRFVIGAGGNFSLTEKIDLVGTASFVDREWSNGSRSGGTKNFNNSDRGYQLDFGARALLAKDFELNGALTYLDIDDFEASVGVGAGAVYKLNKKFALSGNVRHFSNEDETEAFLGVRLNF
jgi:hypothetical protein